MKKLLALLIVSVFIIGCGGAAEASHLAKANHSHGDDSGEDIEIGIKADAPNLVKLADNWTLGMEAGKDLTNTGAGEGWFTYGKVTYTGELFDLGSALNRGE
jgi:hypothetical protein